MFKQNVFLLKVDPEFRIRFTQGRRMFLNDWKMLHKISEFPFMISSSKSPTI